MVKTLLVFFILIKLSFSQQNNVSFYLSNDKNNTIEGATDLGSFMKYIFDKGLIGTLNSRPHYIFVPFSGYILLILLFNA